MNLEEIKNKDAHSYNEYARRNSWASTDEELLLELSKFGKSYLFGYIKSFLPLRHDANILEIGGGKGLVANAIGKFYNDVHLLDRNEDEICGLGAAQKISRLSGTKIIIEKGDFENLPYSDKVFDAVIAKSCLHHATNIEKVFKEISRVLKTGGVFISIEPCRGKFVSEKFALRYFYKMPGTSRDANEHTPGLDAWTRLYKCNNLKITSKSPTYFFPVRQFTGKLKNKIMRFIINIALSLVEHTYFGYAKFFGQPILLPHCFTMRIWGGEYYETAFVAIKK